MKSVKFVIFIFLLAICNVFANPADIGDNYDKYVKLAYSKGVEGIQQLFLDKRISMEDINNSKYSYLSFAAQLCSFDLIKYLYEKGATLNPKNAFSPLASALAHRCDDLSLYLIQHGADLSYEIDGLDMLYFSAQGSSVKLFKYFVEKLKLDFNNCEKIVRTLDGVPFNEKHGTEIFNYINSKTPECTKKWIPVPKRPPYLN